MDLPQAWLDMSLRARRIELRRFFARPVRAQRDYMRLVQAPDHMGVFASIGTNYHYAVFGRDSIETAEDILLLRPDIVREVILVLCQLQGCTTDAITEEEPGKIHHEHRSTQFAGKAIPESSLKILRMLQSMWGKVGADSMTYYGSVDVTPLFVRLVARYIAQEGAAILDEPYVARDATPKTVSDAVFAAIEWVSGHVALHPQGLLAYKRANPKGLLNPVWKDSDTSHLHEDGSLPNYDQPVVSVELQGLAYDALRAGIDLGLGTFGDRERWHSQATAVQQHTLHYLWMEDRRYFAQGLDVGPDGQPRQIRTITSDAGALLDSGLLHHLPAEQGRPYIDGIVSTVCGRDMLTKVGVRCRALKHAQIPGYVDYHGSFAVWPKESFDIAKGLRRSGYARKADDLELRIRRGIERAGDFMELFYVDGRGKVWYEPLSAAAHFESLAPGHHVPVPEPGQAWTIAAALSIANGKHTRAHVARERLHKLMVPLRTTRGRLLKRRALQREH